MSGTIGDLPKHERPRERLARLGPASLSDRELLALVLRNGTKGANAIDVAGAMLTTFGSLAVIARADALDIARVSGVGAAKAAAVVAAFRLGTRVRAESAPLTIFGPRDVASVAVNELSGLRRERSIVLVCDAAHHLRHVEVVSDGSIDRALLPVREVLHAVLRHDGRAFAVAHNHPSGDLNPSAQDLEVTRDLALAAGVVGLRFLDHVVVAGDEWCVVA